MKKLVQIFLILLAFSPLYSNAQCTVNAGPDQNSCADVTFLDDTYSYTGDALGLTWTTSGTGMFAPNANNPSNYRASSEDIASGSVTLTATTFGNTVCTTVSDQMKITYIPMNTVQVSNNNLFSCSTTPVVLAGTVMANATGVTWTTNGTGTFSNLTALNPTYVPSTADVTRGVVELTVTTTGNNGCPAGTHFARLTFTNNNITLNASPDKAVCDNVPVPVSASFTTASGILWSSSGSGVFTPSPTSISPNYIPSAAEISAGKATLTVTTTGNGTCPALTKDIVITISPSAGVATVSAGATPVACGQQVALNGSATNTKGVLWTTSGTGIFVPGATYLHTTYQLSLADATNGSVTFTLTSTGCTTPDSDQITLTVNSLTPSGVQAGPDMTVTTGTAPVSLTGLSGGAVTGVVWSTSGSGIFSDATSKTPTYTPSTADVANGMVRLTIASTGTGCKVQDYMYLTIGNAFSISGTVTANGNLDTGIALLFKQSGNTITFVKFATISSGSYTFTGLPSGTYTIMATPVPGSNVLSTYLPTYSIGTQNWKTAQVITVGTSDATCNIALSTFTNAQPSWNTGLDVIAGVIYAANGSNQSFRQIESTDKPVEHVIIYLTNAAGDKIAYTKTDVNGRFKFDNVKAGNYKVFSEYGGLGMEGDAAPVSVSADGNASTVEDASMFMDAQTRTTSIISNVQALKLVSYPNPVTSAVSVDLVSSVSSGIAKLINQNGMTAFQQEVTFSDSKVTIQMESLPAGIYLLQIVAGDEIYTSKVVKF